MRLKPGDALSEAEIARQMGTSRQPVGEAFIKLAETGFVEIVPQKGTLVLKISSNEVNVARVIRQTVEVTIAREAAKIANAEAIARINANVAAQRRLSKETTQYEYFMELDDQFPPGNS
jgi:DNA-binding GntR family transcriptional regulator